MADQQNVSSASGSSTFARQVQPSHDGQRQNAGKHRPGRTGKQAKRDARQNPAHLQPDGIDNIERTKRDIGKPGFGLGAG